MEFVDGIHQEGEFELTLEILEQRDRFVLNMKYNPELYECRDHRPHDGAPDDPGRRRDP